MNKLTEALIATKDVQYICTLAVIIIKDEILVNVDNCIKGSIINRLEKDIRFQLLNKLTEALIATKDVPYMCTFAEIIIKDGPLRDTDHLDEDIRVLKVSILNRLVFTVLESKDARYIYFLADLLKCGLRTSGLGTDIKPLLYKLVTGLIATRNAAYIYFFAIIIYFLGNCILDKNMYFSEFPEELFYEIYDYVNDECIDEKEKNEKERILSFMISDLQAENNIEEKILACMMSYQLNNNIGDQTKIEFYFRRFLANYNSNSATKLQGIISDATNPLLVTIFKKEIENLSVINPFLGAILNEKVDEKLREFKKNNLYYEDEPNMGGR